MTRSISSLLGAPALCVTLALSSAAYAAPDKGSGKPCVPEFLVDCGPACAASPVGIGAGGAVALAGVGLAAVLLHRRRRGR
jgi:uncharacterized protein (TIGR03382 family)